MTAVSDAIASGAVGERVWFYANYHCNLTCSYCLTGSGPAVARRLLDPALMVELAFQARELGFRSLGVTGGEPFMVSHMPDTLATLANILPLVVLSNGTLFSGPRLERMEHLRGLPISIQISLDSPDPDENDSMRGPENFAKVVKAIPKLVDKGIKVRIATTQEEIGEEALERLCKLHRELGVPDEDHVVRPVISRGRALTAGMGLSAGVENIPCELTISADGAFWSPFGPTVTNGDLDLDLLISRTVNPLSIAANAAVGLATGTSAGADATLGIR
ncbi:MAG: radical SAM protein [Actinomycetota bacterium]|nr:radical SAM protein [Actinomycetota bacterium]